MSTAEPIGPDYAQLTEALSSADVDMSAAEAHGLLTGAIVSPSPPAPARLFFGTGDGFSSPGGRQLLAALEDAARETEYRLRGMEFGFEPMLPAEASLDQRVEALADWCRGFIYGIAAGGVRDPGALNGDAGEFLGDALQISEAETSPDESEEEQERDLAEIVEYVRIGVQLVYEELHGRPDPLSTDPGPE
ncbi:hypothetical protein SVA_3636 [Sulfurifustis variabilis]|uniref:YecA family protein n=1 Tax=Sulfurifustis variabilis TaxID=1675686 RepID=A0A1C7AFN2_9GAMM|nr:YecA family protein [Sulfurifustis variabilis]BAU50172.1 hypothetical protein SVA_3636 [Sulfurifustis variabilis]